MKTIGILLFDDFEELDAIGPWEVLSFWTRMFPDDGWQVTTLSRDGRPVTAAKGLVVHPEHSYKTVPPLQVLIYPGGRGTRDHLRDEAQLGWVRRQREQVPLMTSVCTGSLVYARAGLLAGRLATTHWGSLDLLRDLDPTLDIRRGDRFVDDGDIITSAGVSAGIDMALHLVARLHNTERARQVRRGIQYETDWVPSSRSSATVCVRRPPDRAAGVPAPTAPGGGRGSSFVDQEGRWPRRRLMPQARAMAESTSRAFPVAGGSSCRCSRSECSESLLQPGQGVVDRNDRVPMR